MLSRTADNIYWMTRMVERAQNQVSVLEAAYRMEQLPGAKAEWEAILNVAGQWEAYKNKYDEVTTKNVLSFMIFDADNPSSIYSCWKAGRENGRSERNTLPEEMYESLNATWIDMQGLYYDLLERKGFRDFFEWLKDRSELFRGLTVSTMVKDEAFQFARLGTFIERADNTARILDMKHQILLDRAGKDTELVDYYQWGELLRSLGAWQAYRAVYKTALDPDKIAELLIFSPLFPRSLHNSYDEITTSLSELTPDSPALVMVAQEHAFLHTGSLEEILKERSLHEFLTDFIGYTAKLSNQIRADFM